MISVYMHASQLKMENLMQPGPGKLRAAGQPVSGAQQMTEYIYFYTFNH